jgi:hypothetical protein
MEGVGVVYFTTGPIFPLLLDFMSTDLHKKANIIQVE